MSNQKRIPILESSTFIKAKWDSLVSVLGPFNVHAAEIIPDYSKIKAEYLIENIDLAFASRDSSPWGHKISFEQFCEYVLSYRFRQEPVENCRSYYHEKYKSLCASQFRDTMKV